MLARLRHRRWDWVAFGAAWLLVVQLVLGGFMQGLSAAPAAASGYFPGLICSSGGDAAQTVPTDSSGHARLPNCCLLGCPGLSIAALPTPDSIRIAPIRDADVAIRHAAAAPLPALSDRSSVRARAPPFQPV